MLLFAYYTEALAGSTLSGLPLVVGKSIEEVLLLLLAVFQLCLGIGTTARARFLFLVSLRFRIIILRDLGLEDALGERAAFSRDDGKNLGVIHLLKVHAPSVRVLGSAGWSLGLRDWLFRHGRERVVQPVGLALGKF